MSNSSRSSRIVPAENRWHSALEIAELVDEVESEARADREARGIEPLGAEAILQQNPHDRPNHTKKSPAAAYHAASKAAREKFWEAYSAFVLAYREAADIRRPLTLLKLASETGRGEDCAPWA